MHIDAETRANRLHGALDGLAHLYASQQPGLCVEGERTACLLALLANEAQHLARHHEPRHPGAIND